MLTYVLRGCVLVCMASLACAGIACAEEWVPTARTQQGDLIETDLSSLTRTGDVVHSWARGTPIHPLKDLATGKTFVVTLDERFDDCAGRRFRFGTSVHRDRNGQVVSTSSREGLWQDLVPGSIAEAVARTVCSATAELPDKPLLDDITDGHWATLGPSADNKYILSVNLNKIISIDKSHVIAVSRSDYNAYELLEGFPVKYVVTAYGIDCVNATSVMLGSDIYISARIRVDAVRTPKDKRVIQSMPPGSFLANAYRQICASAAPAAKSSATADAPSPDALFFGTAWATNKGYLVTASHVITGARKIGVYSDGELVGHAEVVADDPANDLAVLKLTATPSRKLDILPLADHAASLGRSVFTLGYPQPDVLGERVKMTAGQVSGTAGVQDDARYIQISLPIQPGNSGGPIIDWDGHVLGVVDFKLRKFSPNQDQTSPAPEMINYAVKASYVRPLLDDLPDLGNYAPIKPAENRDNMIAAARKAVFMLVITQ